VLQWGLWQSLDRKCILDALRAQKTRPAAASVIPVSRFDSAEPLDGTGGTLRFRGTLVENNMSYTVVCSNLLHVNEFQ